MLTRLEVEFYKNTKIRFKMCNFTSQITTLFSVYFDNIINFLSHNFFSFSQKF